MAKFHIGYVIFAPWLLLLLVPVVFFGVGVWLAVDQQQRLTMFIPVDAQVLSSEVQAVVEYDNEGDPYDTFSPVVRYEYELYEQTHTSDQLTAMNMPGDPVTGSERWAMATVARYPIGQRVDAYADPNDPTQVFLLREAIFTPYATALVAMLFVAVEAVVVWSVWLKNKSQPSTRRRLTATAAWVWWGVGLVAYAHYFWLSGPLTLGVATIAVLYFSVGVLPGKLYLQDLCRP